ncbi:amidohydrolase family protein [Streptomycetaceae bacterium NBC_01309]
MDAARLILQNVELDGLGPADVAVADGRVSAVSRRPGSGELRPTVRDTVVDARGGALVHGLADHHMHLHALAAAMRSVDCGPPSVRTAGALAAAVAGAPASADGWVRGTNYHESVAGDLTHDRLDAMERTQPVRVQHRGGALWVVNSAGLRALGLDPEDARAAHYPPGVETDPATGLPNGRLWRLDDWLRSRVPGTGLPDLAEVGRRYASFGVTSLVDATPDLSEAATRHIADSVRAGRLPQDVTLLGGPRDSGVWREFTERTHYGAFKLLPPDHDPWPYDELVARIRRARGDAEYAYSVAVHCVTRESIVLTLAALAEVGPPRVGRDRIEHGAVVPPDLMPFLAARRIHVVTQPGFIAERGDAYASDVDPADLPHLYPYASLLRAGVAVAPSSDAPFGDPDPWHIMRAARDRRTPAGRVLGPDERVGTRTAFDGFRSRGSRPSSLPGNPVEVGHRADLCLLHTGLDEALAAPHHSLVRLTLCRGEVVHDAS